MVSGFLFFFFFFKLTVFIWGILICFYSSPHLKHFIVLSPHLRALALLFRSLCDVQCFEDVFFIVWVIFPDWFCLQFGFTCCLTFLFMCLPWIYSPFHSDLTWTARWSPTVLSWVNVFVFLPIFSLDIWEQITFCLIKHLL